MPSVAPSSKTRLKELSANQPDRIIGSMEELLKERLLKTKKKKKIQYFWNGISFKRLLHLETRKRDII